MSLQFSLKSLHSSYLIQGILDLEASDWSDRSVYVLQQTASIVFCLFPATFDFASVMLHPLLRNRSGFIHLFGQLLESVDDSRDALRNLSLPVGYVTTIRDCSIRWVISRKVTFKQ